ncbi:MAG: iron dependent repressor, metal binding and dimerization domain protein [Verrucomicrobiales bacterium]|nr:iron dependent repressor, metal binding and dimerization domain protein [Verrucomicrobiales bacterium]
MSSSPEKLNVHERVRRQHASELAQDYVEAIYIALEEGRNLRVADLQEIFGVSHVTVIRTLRRIEEQGLLANAKSGELALSPEGRKLAKLSADRHDLLVRFFRALGVSEAQADADAEGAEHHLSEETLGAIRRFLEKS